MAKVTNPLAKMTLAELHDEGLGYLRRARQEFVAAPSAGAAASIAIACFFASMSADNLAASVGTHRADEKTPPDGTPVTALRPNEHAGHHG